MSLVQYSVQAVLTQVEAEIGMFRTSSPSQCTTTLVPGFLVTLINSQRWELRRTLIKSQPASSFLSVFIQGGCWSNRNVMKIHDFNVVVISIFRFEFNFIEEPS